MAAGYGGEGEPLTYSGSSTFTFLAGPSEGIYLDFLNVYTGNGLFESMSLNIYLDGSGVVSQSFTDLSALLAFLCTDYFLGKGIDGLSSVFMTYSFTTSFTGSAFGFDYVVANGPYVPPPNPSSVPLPNALALLLTALGSMLGGRLLRRGQSGNSSLA